MRWTGSSTRGGNERTLHARVLYNWFRMAVVPMVLSTVLLLA